MVVPRLWKLVVVAALGVVGCSKKVDRASGADEVGKPIALAFAPTPTTGDEVRIAITTEPNVDLHVSSERGSVSPMTQRSDTEGHAMVWVRGALGANTLQVNARIDKRESKQVFPFTVTTAEKVVFTDATPRREGAPLVGCSGFLQERGKQDLRLCDTALALAEDGTIAITATAKSLVKLTIGDQVFEAQGGTLAARIELLPAIAALELMFVDKDRPLELPATLELTTGTLSGTLELGHVPITTMFTKIKQGPVRFPGEAVASGKASLLLINEGTWRYAGPSVPLGRVDLVAFDTWKLREAADCEYVVVDSAGKATGEKKSVVRTMRDHTIVVYDRRTGKKLGTRSWTVKTPTCAHWIKTSTPGSHADVDESDLMAWAETFVTR